MSIKPLAISFILGMFFCTILFISIGGLFLGPQIDRFFNPFQGTNIIIQTNAGNQPVFISDIKTVTNTVSNIILIFDDYTNYSQAPFIFSQRADSLNVRIFKRSTDYLIRPWENNFISLYVNPLTGYYGAGYQRRIIGGLYGGLLLDNRPAFSLIGSFAW